jgi:predicted membrane protein
MRESAPTEGAVWNFWDTKQAARPLSVWFCVLLAWGDRVHVRPGAMAPRSAAWRTVFCSVLGADRWVLGQCVCVCVCVKPNTPHSEHSA